MWRRIELIAVGDEVLRGEFLENNTSFLSRELTMLGHSPWRITMLGDDRKILSREISEAVKRSDTVIVTGGLGPTVDDVTKDAVIDALGCGTEWRDEIAAKIERRFRLLGKKVPESYKDQARVPAGARILENRIGMAVGLEIEGEDFRIILLPGVPAEMKQIFYESILPAVPVEDSGMRVRIRTFGLTETQLEEKIKDILSELEKLSGEEESCCRDFMKYKKVDGPMAWIALNEDESSPIIERYDMDIIVTVAKYTANLLAEESGYVSLVAFYDPPGKSDLIQLRMRRSQNFKTLDLREVIASLGITNGGGHEGAVGFRVPRGEVEDFPAFIDGIVAGTVKMVVLD